MNVKGLNIKINVAAIKAVIGHLVGGRQKIWGGAIAPLPLSGYASPGLSLQRHIKSILRNALIFIALEQKHTSLQNILEFHRRIQ